jgi:hypothetical protein
MKVIDLLNEIAKGEQPSHIRMYGRDWYWNNYDGYVTEGSLSTTPDAQIYLFSQYRLDFALDKEVEIIGEDKEIEHYDMFDYFTGYKFGCTDKDLLDHLQRNFVNINQELDYLIKAVNELKKGK